MTVFLYQWMFLKYLIWFLVAWTWNEMPNILWTKGQRDHADLSLVVYCQNSRAYVHNLSQEFYIKLACSVYIHILNVKGPKVYHLKI